MLLACFEKRTNASDLHPAHASSRWLGRVAVTKSGLPSQTHSPITMLFFMQLIPPKPLLLALLAGLAWLPALLQA